MDERDVMNERAVMGANNFIEQLKVEYKKIKFCEGKKFTFRPPRTIIYENFLTWVEGLDVDVEHENYNTECETNDTNGQFSGLIEQNYYKLTMLHELGHALLEHKNYGVDIERIKMERAAWEKAKELCIIYNVRYDEEFVEMKMDTYRDWLHMKSRCSKCGLTRFQNENGKYVCPGCEMWG